MQAVPAGAPMRPEQAWRQGLVAVESPGASTVQHAPSTPVWAPASHAHPIVALRPTCRLHSLHHLAHVGGGDAKVSKALPQVVALHTVVVGLEGGEGEGWQGR